MSASGNISARNRFFYGWVVVATGAFLMATNAGIINSYGVFFKPLAADFGWSRATTSTVQSVMMILLGLFAPGAGWLADRFGPAKMLGICGCLAGVGLALTSRTEALWQIYLTYSLLTAIGFCATFPVTSFAAARWFPQRRGLALGLVAAGSGLGNLVVIPTVARFIASFGWSTTYIILGAATFAIMIAGAILLRRTPESSDLPPLDTPPIHGQSRPTVRPLRGSDGGFGLRSIIRTDTLWILVGIFFLFQFCSQMVAVHMVNYATDLGITTLVAATVVSAIGLSSTTGRVLMGSVSDRFGNLNTLIAGAVGVAVGLVLLIYSRELWMFYTFAIIFGFSLGSEVPQQTALIGKYFGLRVMLVGIAHGGGNIGGAAGAWVGGQVFDMTQSYQVAFIIGIAAIACALASTLLLVRRDKARQKKKEGLTPLSRA